MAWAYLKFCYVRSFLEEGMTKTLKLCATQCASLMLVMLAAAVFCLPSFADEAANNNGVVIGLDHKTGRPNILIAWRNTERILETEVEVKNLTHEQVSGAMSIAILDGEGKVLLKSPGPPEHGQIVTLPPRSKGGEEGKIVQLKGTLAMNQLFDSLDRNRLPYAVAVELTPVSGDFSGAYAVKSFGANSRVVPGSPIFREFSFRNITKEPLSLEWRLNSTPLPLGWQISSTPKTGEHMTVPPDGVVHGYLSVTASDRASEGEHVDLVMSALNTKNDRPAFTTEWFAVQDTVPPTVTGLGYTVNEDTGTVQVSVTANDVTSGLKEASGIRVEYSTDGGLTYATKVMAYDAGNFVGPTSFQTLLGPFPAGTHITANLVAEDIAGNISQRRLEPITITSTASASGQKNNSQTAQAIVGPGSN
jgi:hypothetical protein